MAQPPSYTRQADFTDWSQERPSDPHQGTSLDAEFNALATTVAAVLANLVLIQRDDGALKNASVGVDTLSAAVLALISASNGITAAAWLTATAYTAGTHWVTEDTGTYVCATSHTSGTFATDLAAGKWVLIYDSAGATPGDGSVTTAKLADGAVTEAKLDIASLDVTGTLRGQSGVAAGTATLGEILAAKLAAGDVIAKVERTTQGQGIVGLKWGGGTSGVDWYARMDDASDTLELYDGTNVRVKWLNVGGEFLTDVAGRVRATADSTPASGAGIGLRYLSNIGYLDSYDHTGSAWKALAMRGSTAKIYCGGVLVVDGSSTNVSFPVEASIGSSAYAIGYRHVPQNQKNTAYTLVLADAGKHVYSENSGAQSITVPPNSSVAFEIGTAIALVNRGTDPITVTQGAGVTIRWAGTTSTGNRTLAVNGVVTLLKIETNVWMITGAGLS